MISILPRLALVLVSDGDRDDTVFHLFEGKDVTIRDLLIRGGANPAGTAADTGGIFSGANAVLDAPIGH
jgi:hypothetical protein